jgi:anti-sigma factor RsiW
VTPIFSRRELACQEVVELISDYIEGALPRRERRRLEAHLQGCDHCTEYLAQMRTTIRLEGRLRSEDLTPQMRDELAALYRRWIAGEVR